MIELIISLALAAILLLFVVFGLLWGLKRGLKKTLFRAAWLAVTAVLLFVFTPMVTRAVMNADLSALDLNVGGEQVTTLQEYVVTLLGQDADLGQIAADNPQAVSSLVQIASLAVNVFVFVLLFWALKIVLWPIWAILSAIFIRKRTLSGEKKPQHRLWGMLAGAVLGLLVCMITLTPLTGTANFALAVEDQTKGTALAAQLADGQADPDKGLLLQAAGEENARYIELYRDSVGRKILRYTGMEALSDWIYGGLSSNTVNGVRVSLTDEVLTALSVADRGFALLDVDFENLTKEQISGLLSDLRGLNEDIFSIGVLSAVGNDLMPYFIAKAADGEWFELPDLGTPELNAALSDTLLGLEGLTFADLKNEIDQVLDVGVLLNNEDILPDLLAGGEPDFEAIAAKVDEDFASSLADALFSMKSITVAFPAFLGAGLDFAIEELGGALPEGAGGSATAEQMKTFLVDLLADGVELYQSLDPDSDYYLTQPSLALAGSLLDTVRQYPGIGAERYAALVNAFEGKLRTALEENLTDPALEGIRSVLFDLVDGLSEADSFGADFAALGEKFDDFVAFADGVRAEPAEVRLTELGGVLDGFAQTALFGDSLNDLLSAGLDYAKTVLPEDFASLSANLDSMKGRLDEVQSWETELGHYMGLYEVIEEVGGDTFDPETLFEADNEGNNDDYVHDIRFVGALRRSFERGRGLHPAAARAQVGVRDPARPGRKLPGQLRPGRRHAGPDPRQPAGGRELRLGGRICRRQAAGRRGAEHLRRSDRGAGPVGGRRPGRDRAGKQSAALPRRGERDDLRRRGRTVGQRAGRSGRFRGDRFLKDGGTHHARPRLRRRNGRPVQPLRRGQRAGCLLAGQSGSDRAGRDIGQL